RALAAAIRRIGFDLILCGKYATDAETAQVPPMLAELLDLPQVTGVTQIEWHDRTFSATREVDYGFETWQGELPALLTAAERLCKPLRVTPQDLERVKEAPIEILQAAQLGDVSQFGLQGSPTWVEAIESIEPPRKRMIRQASDGIERVVRETVDDLLREGLFGEWKRATHETILPGAVRPASEKGIWVVAEVIQDALRPVTFEMLGRAVQLAEQNGGHVGALALGSNARQFADALAAHGADQILLAEHPALQHYATEPYARIVADAIASHKPFAVFFASTANGRDLAPRVAAKLNIGLTGDVIGAHFDAQGRLVQLKPAFGGNIVAPILSKTTPVMATVRPGMLSRAQADSTRRAEIVAIPVPDTTTRVTRQSSETVTDEGVHLDDAEIVIGVGMGVGGPENLAVVQELCR